MAELLISTDHGQQLALLELLDGGERPGLEVAPREVAEQVADGAQAEPLGDALVAGAGPLVLGLAEHRLDG